MRLKSSAKLLSAIVLISALSLMTGVPLLHTASASPTQQEQPNRATPLPRNVADAVLQEIARRSSVPIGSLKIVRAEPRTWSDGCLGLAESGQFCTQALVPGWQISVQSKTKQWIYRTDRAGSIVKLDRQTKSNSSPTAEDQRSVTSQVLFSSTASGGFAGQTAETLLLTNGRVLRYRINPNGTKSLTRSWRISETQLQEFRSILAREGFERFDRQDFAATAGSADFMTVTLSSPTGTVQYADSVQSRLPRSLQTIITAWNNLTRFS